MKLKTIIGKIASQPAIVPMQDSVMVFILVETPEGYKEFFCEVGKLPIGDTVAVHNTKFSNVALSSVGDEVLIRVNTDTIKTSEESRIISFANKSKNIGAMSLYKNV